MTTYRETILRSEHFRGVRGINEALSLLVCIQQLPAKSVLKRTSEVKQTNKKTWRQKGTGRPADELITVGLRVAHPRISRREVHKIKVKNTSGKDPSISLNYTFRIVGGGDPLHLIT